MPVKRRPAYWEALHEANQRYRQAWDRAERLQDELDHVKKSRAYRFFCWWRRLTALWRSRLGEQVQHLCFPSEILDNPQVRASGRVSILIPFKDRLELLRNCLLSVRRGSPRPAEI